MPMPVTSIAGSQVKLSRQAEQLGLVVEGEVDQGVRATQSQLAGNVCTMGANGAGTDPHFGTDLLVGMILGNVLEDYDFGGGERCQPGVLIEQYTHALPAAQDQS